MLPNEAKATAAIAETFADIFQVLAELLDYGLYLAKGTFTGGAGISEMTLSAATNLHVSACRKFRQILQLATIAQADGADIILRALFETQITSAFITYPAITIRNPSGGGIEKAKSDLDQNLRAHLYYAFCEVKHQQWLQALAETESAGDWARQQLKARTESIKLIDQLGGPWLKDFQGHASTCAGISTKQLAYSLGSETYEYYLRTYAVQSALVHASWAGKYSEMVSNGSNPGSMVSWCDEDFMVVRVLTLSSLIFVLCLVQFAEVRNDRPQRRDEINRLADRVHSVIDPWSQKYEEQFSEPLDATRTNNAAN